MKEGFLVSFIDGPLGGQQHMMRDPGRVLEFPYVSTPPRQLDHGDIAFSLAFYEQVELGRNTAGVLWATYRLRS